MNAPPVLAVFGAALEPQPFDPEVDTLLDSLTDEEAFGLEHLDDDEMEAALGALLPRTKKVFPKLRRKAKRRLFRKFRRKSLNRRLRKVFHKDRPGWKKATSPAYLVRRTWQGLVHGRWKEKDIRRALRKQRRVVSKRARERWKQRRAQGPTTYTLDDQVRGAFGRVPKSRAKQLLARRRALEDLLRDPDYADEALVEYEAFLDGLTPDERAALAWLEIRDRIREAGAPKGDDVPGDEFGLVLLLAPAAAAVTAAAIRTRSERIAAAQRRLRRGRPLRMRQVVTLRRDRAWLARQLPDVATERKRARLQNQLAQIDDALRRGAA